MKHIAFYLTIFSIFTFIGCNESQDTKSIEKNDPLTNILIKDKGNENENSSL